MLSRIQVVLLWVLASLIHTSASGDPSSAQRPDVTAYAFVRKSSKDEVDGTSTTSSQKDSIVSNSHQSKSRSTSSSVVSSSLLYDGGCVVSAEAIMCSGGDSAYDKFFSLMNFGGDEYDDEEESDDDDDDDDGHSSMLSNASLRRSKVGANQYQQPLHHSKEIHSSPAQDKGGLVANAPSWSKLHARHISLR
jgi:hypothetical protein